MTHTIQDIISYARRVLAPEVFEVFLRNDPKHHAPIYHELGLLGHIYAVMEIAKKLTQITGLDVTELAYYHDLGKIPRFPQALSLVGKGLNPAPAYRAHETTSARMAREAGELTQTEVRVIKFHGLAYQARPGTIIERLNHHERSVAQWLVLCAADIIGKGRTDPQNMERLAVARKFQEVAGMVWPEGEESHLLHHCNLAVYNWPLPRTPSFV